MSTIAEWRAVYDEVRADFPVLPPISDAMFREAPAGSGIAYFMGLDERGTPTFIVPTFIDLNREIMVHEVFHALHAVAARMRDAAERRGTAADDIVVEVSAILTPTRSFLADLLRKEYVAEAGRKSYTGDVADARLRYYPPPAEQRSPFPVEELRAYFAQAHQPRASRTEERPMTTIADPAGYLLSFGVTRPFADLTLPQFGLHSGIDIGMPYDAPVPAVRAGVVEIDDDSAYYDPSAPATWSGVSVWIRCDDGELWGYCHLVSNVVMRGQRIAAGDVIGFCGSTGASTGPHLHLERRAPSGVAIDPYEEVLMLSQDALEQIRGIIREEVGKVGASVERKLDSGFNSTLTTIADRVVAGDKKTATSEID